MTKTKYWILTNHFGGGCEDFDIKIVKPDPVRSVRTGDFLPRVVMKMIMLMGIIWFSSPTSKLEFMNTCSLI